MDQRSAPYDTLTRGEYRVENNTWGSHQVHDYSQAVFAGPEGGGGPRFAWTWDYPAELPDAVKAFPEVIFGKKPWAWTSTTGRLPRPVSPVPSVRVAFDLRTEATGRYNSAFAIWLTRSAQAAGEPDVSHEVMFWVDRQDDPAPAGRRLGSVTLADGRPCDLWAGRVKTWECFAFVFHRPYSAGVLECGYYLEHLLRAGHLPADVHIASLEFGNEIWHGSGRTVLNEYRVAVADGPPPAPTADPDRAYLRLDLPERAEVFIEDTRMPGTAARRVFRSPPIDRGRDHVYRVRVVTDRSDGPGSEEREVVVRAGEVADVSFTGGSTG
jgi:uncharacterized protein (TIGR03000 family)